MRLGETLITASAHAKCPHSLRHGCFNPRSFVRELPKRWRVLTRSGLLLGHMMFLFPHRNHSSVCLSTERTARAGLTIFCRKLDFDDLIVASITGWCPAGAFMSGRTGRLVCLPIELETTGSKALFCLALPLVVRSGASNQINSIVELTCHELFGLGRVRVR